MAAGSVHRQSADRGDDHWRFRRHDDLWWYYTPERYWAVFQDNRWVPYERATLYARDDLVNTPNRGPQRQLGTTTGVRPDYLGNGIYPRAEDGQPASSP